MSGLFFFNLTAIAAHDNYVIPAQVTNFSNFSAAHDLMSCPMEYSTALSSSEKSVQLRNPVQTQYVFTQKKYPFADFWTQVTQKLSLIPEYEHKTQENVQKIQMDIVLFVFLPKNDRTVSNKLKPLKNLGKMIAQLK